MDNNNNNDNREFIDLREGAEEQQNTGNSQSPMPSHYPPSPRRKNKASFIILAAVLVIAGLIGGSHLVISSVQNVVFDSLANGSSIPGDGISFNNTNVVLDINLVSNSVVLQTHSGPDIFITYTPPTIGNYTRPHYEFSQGNTRLQIIEERRNNWSIGINNIQRGVLAVFIPENVNGVFDSLNIAATSGRIEIFGDDGNRLANNVSVNVTSGGIFVYDFTADRVNFGATSGGVTLRDVGSSGNLTAHATSGGVSANNITASGDISLTTTSGGVRANNITADGNLSMGSTSGGVRAGDIFVAGNLSVNVTSGGITMENSEILGNTNGRATSGGITFTNVDLDESRMNLSATSGRITVNGERLDR